jgi:hypothetical protein
MIAIIVAGIVAVVVVAVDEGRADDSAADAATTATMSAASTTIAQSRTPTPSPRRTPTAVPTRKPTAVARTNGGDDPVCARALSRYHYADFADLEFNMVSSGCEMRDGRWLPINNHAGWTNADYQCNQLSYEIESIVGDNYPEHAFDPDVDALIALQDNSCQWDAFDTGYWSAR